MDAFCNNDFKGAFFFCVLLGYHRVKGILNPKKKMSSMALRLIDISWIKTGSQPYWKITYSMYYRQFSMNDNSYLSHRIINGFPWI